MKLTRGIKSPARGNKVMLCIAIYLVLFIITTQILLPELGAMAMAAISQIGGMVVPILAYLLFTKQKPRDIFELKPLSGTNTLLVIAISIALIPMTLFAMYLLSLVFVPTLEFLTMDTVVLPFPFWIALITGAILPSIFEELLYRGAIYSEYQGEGHGASIGMTALMTGIFFGIKHLNFHQAIYAAALGVVFAYLVYYTRSILAPIICHFIINSAILLLTYIEVFVEFIRELMVGNIISLLVIVGASVVMFPVLIICLKKLKAYYIATIPTKDVVLKSTKNVAVKPKIFTWALWVALSIFLAIMIFQEIGMRASLS